MASSYAVRSTPAETFNKITVSCWFKGIADGTQRNFWGLYDNSSSNRFFALYYSTNGSLYGYWKQNEGTFFTLGTTQKFRDPNAWYHFVMTMDTTLSTAADRVKFYVNGERVTSFEDGLDTITQNQTCNLMNGTTDGRMQWGGGKVSGTQYYWNGSMSHCHMCVGYAYDASSFGSTDATTGEWKINTSPSVSYGTNGGFWFKDGSQLTDSSTNSNTLTSSGTLTNTEDCPSNVFATMNPHYRASGIALSNGNLTSIGSSAGTTVCSTIAVNSGKWYWEAKCNAASPHDYFNVGVIKTQTRIDNLSYPADSGSSGYILAKDGYIYYNGSQSLNTGTTVSPGDIVGFILDMDAGTLKLKKNGSDVYSGNAVVSSLNTGDHWYVTHGANPSNVDFNFGNGYFGTTAISSEGTNASNIGKFEYDVPANHTAICTKGLNE